MASSAVPAVAACIRVVSAGLLMTALYYSYKDTDCAEECKKCRAAACFHEPTGNVPRSQQSSGLFTNAKQPGHLEYLHSGAKLTMVHQHCKA